MGCGKFDYFNSRLQFIFNIFDGLPEIDSKFRTRVSGLGWFARQARNSLYDIFIAS